MLKYFVKWEQRFPWRALIECTGGELKGVDLDLNHIPDAAMTVAILALFAKAQRPFEILKLAR